MNDKKNGAEGILKKILLSVSVVVVLLVGVFLVNNMLSANRQPENVAQPNDTQESALLAEIEDLRSIIYMMTSEEGAEEEIVEYEGVTIISSSHAREIAVNLIGHGTATGIVLFSEDDNLKYAVEVLSENPETSYIVNIDAVNGRVMSMNSYNVASGEYELTDVTYDAASLQPSATTQSPAAAQTTASQASPSPAATPSPQATPSPAASPAASPSPGGTSSPSPGGSSPGGWSSPSPGGSSPSASWSWSTGR